MKKLIRIFFISILFSSCSTNLINYDSSTKDVSIQIHDIQGCSHTSPYVGKHISKLSGVVTWKESDGFYMQGTIPDNEDCSSEGIFVFTKNYPKVIPGDLVSVSGVIQEYASNDQTDSLTITEIVSDSISVTKTDQDLPQPVIIGSDGRIPPLQNIDDDAFSTFDPESDGIDFYESLESMRVEVDHAQVVGPSNSYSEIIVIPHDISNYEVISQQGALLASQGDQNPERLRVVLPDSWKKPIKIGSIFTTPIIGILTYKYEYYQLLTTNLPTINNSNPDFEKLKSIQNSNHIRLITYNVENLSRFDSPRIEKLSKQIVNSLGSPDILILEEIEDDSGTDDDGVTSADLTIKKIVDTIQKNKGPEYTFIDFSPKNNMSGGISGGNIRTVILFRTDVNLEAVPIKIESTNSAFSNSRIPIAVHFSKKSDEFIVIGTHLISNNANSPEFGNKQPIIEPDEPIRMSQTQWIVNFVSVLQSEYPKSSIFIAGDFNDTPDSKSLSIFNNNGFLNLSDQISANERYSILFEGNAYLYDQIFFKPIGLKNINIASANIIHMNTDLPEDNQISDHDPFSVDFTFSNQ